MLPSLVAAAPARILTSGQLGQPSGAPPPSPRLTSNARARAVDLAIVPARVSRANASV